MNSCDELLRLAELVRELQQKTPPDGQASLDGLIRHVAESVPGARYAGITIAGRRRLETPAATGRYPIVLDEIQNREGEGPCVADAWDHDTIRIDDLAKAGRWPRYRRGALKHTPIRSVLSFKLFRGSQTAGTLNLYAEQARAFDDDSLRAGLAVAAHAAVAWDILQRAKQFRDALASRDVIGQAKGILMERFEIDSVGAFDLLKRLSQESNTPVAELAEKLIDAEHPLRRRRGA